ncbi:16S rRNA processing protein RimM [Candidatus Magnetomorum sp. HK-1]|nr:16S rRNA processing protein RimM [Candidatus Magnetomorum sp. HK-1]
MAGKIIGVHGIRGVFKFQSFVESELLTPGNPLFYHSTDHKIHRFSILSIKPHKRNYLITLEGISDRTQAEAFVDTDIYIERKALPDLDSDTYYWFEIVGLDVVDTSGIHQGVVRSIMETGSNDVYVIEKNNDEYLLPAITSVIKDIDLDQHRIIVDLPDGLQ